MIAAVEQAPTAIAGSDAPATRHRQTRQTLRGEAQTLQGQQGGDLRFAGFAGFTGFESHYARDRAYTRVRVRAHAPDRAHGPNQTLQTLQTLRPASGSR